MTIAHSNIPGLDPAATVGGPTPQLRITPDMLRDVACEACKNQTFERIVFLRKVPALLSPSQKEEVIAIPAYACNACGNVNKEFLANVPFEKRESTLVVPGLESPSEAGKPSNAQNAPGGAIYTGK